MGHLGMAKKARIESATRDYTDYHSLTTESCQGKLKPPTSQNVTV